MLEEESSKANKIDRNQNRTTQNKKIAEEKITTEDDDKDKDNMHIDDDMENDETIEIKPSNEPKRTISVPKTSHQISPSIKSDSVKTRSPVRKNTSKELSLKVDDFEEINAKQTKSPEEVRNDGFEMLEIILTKQIEEFKATIKELMYTDRNRAQKIRKTIKEYEEDLRLIKLAHSSLNVPLPLYTIEECELRFEIANHDVSEHEIEITIEKMMDVKPVTTSKDPYPGYHIACSFQHPESTQKFKTSTNNTYIYNHVHRFIIDRQKKLEKKKILVEVFKPGQWFSEGILFGKCEIPLVDLFTTCTQHFVANVVKDKRKVATIYVSFRIKYPLKERRYETKRVNQIRIKKHFGSYNNDSVSKEKANLNTSSEKIKIEQLNQTEPKNIEPEKSKEIIRSAPQKNAAPKKPSPSPPIQQKDDNLNQFYLVPIDHLFSLGVLEYEKTRAMQFLQIAKRNKNEDSILDLEQRISEINTKVMLLNYQAQSGQLSQDDYIAIVKKKIEEELTIAKKLKTTNKEAALEAMKRKKIMEKELAGG